MLYSLIWFFEKLISLLSKYESVKIYWLSVKLDWFKQSKRGYCKSVKFHWLLQWKLTDLTVKIFFPLIQLMIINSFNSEIYFLTGESVKRQITDSISKNLTDSDLESRFRKLFDNTIKILFGICVTKLFFWPEKFVVGSAKLF